MIYQATHLVNFAQGEMAMFSTYIAWALINAGVPYWVAFFAHGRVRVRARRRDRARRHAPGRRRAGAAGRHRLHRPAGDLQQRRRLDLHATRSSRSRARSRRSRCSADRTCRRTSSARSASRWSCWRCCSRSSASRRSAWRCARRRRTRSSSRLVGIRVGWMLALGWGLAAAIGAIAGMMVAPIVFLDPNMMAGILLYAFAGGAARRHRQPGRRGARRLHRRRARERRSAPTSSAPSSSSTVALVLIVGVLLVKPSGLFGTVVSVTRV